MARGGIRKVVDGMENKFIVLHDYDTGDPVYILPELIGVIRVLPAVPPNRVLGMPPIAKRTRIDTKNGDIFLVHESSEAVVSLLKSGGL